MYDYGAGLAGRLCVEFNIRALGAPIDRNSAEYRSGERDRAILGTATLIGPAVGIGRWLATRSVSGIKHAWSSAGSAFKSLRTYFTRGGAGPAVSGAGARFITNPAGRALDLRVFQGLTRNPGTVNVGRSGAIRPLTGPANSYSVTSGGHRLVYGPQGRLAYDVSPTRIKAFQWNQAPNGQWFPRTGSDLKFTDVPQAVLNALGF